MIAGAVVAVLVFSWTGAGVARAFTDVPGGHRYAQAINELAQFGIVSGKSDGTFRPDDPVTRAQFAKMMCGLLALDVNEEQSFAPFVDLGPDRLGDLYPHEYVGAAYRAGITTGKTATTFDPYSYITRLQVISMVVRMADNLQPGLLAAVPEALALRVGWADDPMGGPKRLFRRLRREDSQARRRRDPGRAGSPAKGETPEGETL